ncbi:C-type lectin domain family 4 member E-like [Eriocheir sinensis]|uniref:C-type lectin domain family 4 member E-like n=1 Tax=Eriocheir sinensis TaxID=95602 RepID=UPI0021CA3B77|nr:C-type lectin domain family 4 member E-like [Eriocheir sinensis]
MALHGTAPILLLAAALVALPTALAKSCQTPFVPLNNQWCVHALTNVPGKTYTWPSAREECKKLGGDLVVVDTQGKMEALTAHLAATFTEDDSSFPGFVKLYPYWVGGSNEAGQWQWVNGSPMSLTSNLWLPDNPSGGPSNIQYALLVRVGRSKRRYLRSEPSTNDAPGYVCEQ